MGTVESSLGISEVLGKPTSTVILKVSWKVHTVEGFNGMPNFDGCPIPALKAWKLGGRLVTLQLPEHLCMQR